MSLAKFSLTCLMLLTLNFSYGASQYMKLHSKDGTQINALLVTPKKIKAAILVIHGLQSHVEWHRSAMEEWAKSDILSLAFDRRGSGLSEGERGHFNSVDELLEDTTAAYEELKRSLPPSTPIYIFGNSFGFFLSVPFTKRFENEIKGLILSAPASTSTKESDYSLKEKAKILISRPHARYKVAFSTDFITTNPKGLEYIRNDPYFLKEFTASFLRSTLLMRTLANYNFKKLNVPALVIFASKDRIVDNKKAMKKLSSTAAASSKIVLIEGDHDLTLSGQGSKVNETILEWIF